jgi:hypothetical protein
VRVRARVRETERQSSFTRVALVVRIPRFHLLSSTLDPIDASLTGMYTEGREQGATMTAL